MGKPHPSPPGDTFSNALRSHPNVNKVSQGHLEYATYVIAVQEVSSKSETDWSTANHSEGSLNHYWSIVNRYDSFTTTFTIKNTYRTGQHYPVPSPPLGRGGTGHTKNPRVLGGEGSFCGAGAAIYITKNTSTVS